MYFWRYVSKTPPPEPENKVNSLYGSIVGVLFEEFYKHKMWNSSTIVADMLGQVDRVAATVCASELKKGLLDFTVKASNYASLEAVKEEVRETIPRGLRSIKAHRFVSTGAQAEVVLDWTYMSGSTKHIVGGRADFIMRRPAPLSDLVILDGKGSRHFGKYVEPDQLLWYGALYKQKFGVYPDQLGFLFWRAEPDQSLCWVVWGPVDADRVLASAVRTIAEIVELRAGLSEEPYEKNRDPKAKEESAQAWRQVNKDVLPLVEERFAPRAHSQHCRLCPYKTVCAAGTKVLTSLSKTRGNLMPIPGISVVEVE